MCSPFRFDEECREQVADGLKSRGIHLYPDTSPTRYLSRSCFWNAAIHDSATVSCKLKSNSGLICKSTNRFSPIVCFWVKCQVKSSQVVGPAAMKIIKDQKGDFCKEIYHISRPYCFVLVEEPCSQHAAFKEGRSQ